MYGDACSLDDCVSDVVLSKLIYTVSQKKRQATIVLFITSPTVDQLSEFLH